jgi:hypothetical protein
MLHLDFKDTQGHLFQDEGSISTLHRNTHTKNHEPSNMSSIDHTPDIVGTRIDNCYW